MNDLLNQYNLLVEQARNLGLLSYRPVKRFRPADSGPVRIAQIDGDIREAQSRIEASGEVAPAVEAEATTMDAAIEEAIQPEDTTMAKAKKAKAPKAAKAAKTKTPKAAGTAKRGRPPTNGETIAAKTAAYNELVPAAKKKGISWAKNHTSFFGSHTAADAQLKRLQEAIKSA